MVWRFVGFFLYQLGGGLLGWWLGWDIGIQAGLIAGAITWLPVDSLRAARILDWLRRSDAAVAPAVGGVWGDVVDRVWRALRSSEVQTQDARHRLQDFLAAIQASPSGVVLLDSQGRIEWCNRTAADQFGFDLQRDLLQQVTNLVRDPEFIAYYNQVGGAHGDVVIPAPSSLSSRPIKLSIHLHPYGQGRGLLLSRDVTALEQAEVMRRDFVANVSHEIRTPLTVLKGFVETLQNIPLDAEQRAHYLALMDSQADRMQTLVSDLLTLSRLEGSPLPGTGEWTAVTVLMAQCEQQGRALSEVLGKAQELLFHQPAALELAGAPRELLSAFSNLVSNAIRYTSPAGSIKVRWRTLPNGCGEFSVQDTGCGIAPEHISRLTERFYKVERGRSRETGGTGLGLAIVKHVVQRHGGELKIESTLGVGSIFAIRFPASRLRAATRQSGTSAQPATESEEG